MMEKARASGIILILLGVVLLAGYGLYLFVQSDVPQWIRIGIVLLVAGFLVLLLSLARERLMDIRSEQGAKAGKNRRR